MLRWLLPLLSLVLLAFPLHADDAPPAGKKAAENAKVITKNLLAHLPRHPGAGWDEFQLRVVDRIGTSEYATSAGWELWADGKETPYLQITNGLLQLYGDNPDALALLLGHEFGVLILGHAPRKDSQMRIGGACTNRRRQADADLFAAELVLKSGYSLRRGISGLERRLKELPDTMRPVVAERIDRMRQFLEGKRLDPGEELWRLMPAFDAGLTFRASEQYSPAEACFMSVVHEFPQSGDAWTLLVLCRLLHYRACLLHEQAPLHPLSITLSNGKTVAPGEDTDEILTKLAKATRTTPAVPSATIKRFWFEAHGIAIFASDESLAIVLLAKGPVVKWPGADGKPAGLLRIGMKRKQVEALPSGDRYALRPFLSSQPRVCAYYPALGVAVIYDSDGPDGVVTSVIVGGVARG